MGALAKYDPSPGLTATFRGLDKLIESSKRVVEIADATASVKRDADGELIRPEGMSDEAWNIHLDAMKPANRAPLYLVSHFRRIESVQKIAGNLAGGGHAPVVQFIQLNQMNQPAYPVVDVTPAEKG